MAHTLLTPGLCWSPPVTDNSTRRQFGDKLPVTKRSAIRGGFTDRNATVLAWSDGVPRDLVVGETWAWRPQKCLNFIGPV